jgi:hypothetical protein
MWSFASLLTGGRLFFNTSSVRLSTKTPKLGR